MLKDQLQLLLKEFTTLKEKIKHTLETNQKLNESTHKLELQLKENSEHEKVLTQLAQEFEELSKELEK